MWNNMHVVSTNFAKTFLWKHKHDVKLWCQKQHTPSKNEQHTSLKNT